MPEVNGVFGAIKLPDVKKYESLPPVNLIYISDSVSLSPIQKCHAEIQTFCFPFHHFKGGKKKLNCFETIFLWIEMLNITMFTRKQD